MTTYEAELVLDCRRELSEGPIWDSRANRLFFVDIMTGDLLWVDSVAKRDGVVHVGDMLCAVVPARRGAWACVTRGGFDWLDDGGKFVPITNPVTGEAGIRFNDGKCDPAGRFWAGTMHLQVRENAGGLFRLDVDQTVHPMIDNVTISNGLAWSADGATMYYIDSPRRDVQAFDYDLETGTIRNARTAIHMPESISGVPDGMCIDVEGMLWVAVCGGHGVYRWDPGTGELLGKIELPVSLPTSCAFGGQDLEVLYITTAYEDMTADERAKEPHAGSIVAARPGVRGTPADAYAG